jgi:hypothetical protein
MDAAAFIQICRCDVVAS